MFLRVQRVRFIPIDSHAVDCRFLHFYAFDLMCALLDSIDLTNRQKMPLTFEEIADAGLPARVSEPNKSAHSLFKLVIATFMAALCGGLVYFFYFYKLTPELPKSMEALIVLDVEVSDGVMPHQFDEVTEFKDSLNRHKEHYKTPEYRETPLAAKAVPAMPSAEDVRTAEVANEAMQDSAGPFFSKDIEKVKDTWSQLFGEAEVVQSSTLEMDESSESRDVAWTGVEFTVKSELEETVPEIVSSRESLDVNQVELPPNTEVQIDFVRDWDGLILIPNNVQLARAYTTGVRLNRVEAHPIDGDRLRVWVRIENMMGHDLEVETACEFRFENQDMSPANFRSSRIPADGALDVYFVSTKDRVRSYTIMVKR
jgi:hypothetical protein